jgi:H+-transporting ATPase
LKGVGITPIMLTGDNISVAREIAKQVGLGDKIVCISEIKALPELEQAAAILNCNGIAEIFPEDKFWVVKILQANTKTVGMTGDGVNDSPALKQAELGLAVSNSADVAKAAASMVITEPGTSQILEAIKISRQAYQRMLTWTLKKICRSIQFMAILSVGFFWLQDIIVSISGLMLLVVVNDFMTMSLAVDNSRSSKNPNAWNVKNITLASIFLGILFFIIELALLVFAQSYLHLGLDQIKTLMLISLVYTGQFGIIIVRERGFFWKSMPARFVSITIAFAMVLFTLLAIFGVVLTPLPAWLVLFTLAVCVIFVLLMDPLKIYAFKRLGIS